MMWLETGVVIVLTIIIILYMSKSREGLELAPVPVMQDPQYWDGRQMAACSQCKDSRECPNCPQFALYTRPQTPIEGFEVPTPRFPIMPSPQDAWAAALNAKDNVINYDTYDEDSASLARPLVYDLDLDYMTSRERTGACSALSRSVRARAPFGQNVDVSVLGTQNDDIFDGDRAVVRGRQMCRNSTNNPVSNLLYATGMNLPINARPAIDCQFMSHNGYSYKQRCDSSW